MRKYPEHIYIYIHMRETDGLIYYVGQGKEYRAWNTHGRNDHWQKTRKKHGRTVFLVDWGLTKDQADEMEVSLIKHYRELGHPITNKTDGGEGVNGMTLDDEQRTKLSRSHGRGEVNCSNGMTFGSTQLAAEWLNKNGRPKARQGHVSACCRGERLGAYGHAWWYGGDTPKIYEPRYERMSRTRSTRVLCSNGMIFNNQKDAESWLRLNGFPKANQTGVGQAMRGVIRKYHGFEWGKYDD